MSYSKSYVDMRGLTLVNKNKLQIGEKIKAQRKRLGLTQVDLAEKADMHEKQISRIEAGTNQPTIENFLKIIEVLGLKMNDFDATQKPNKLRDDLVFILDNSTDRELKIFLDVVNSLKKSLNTRK